MNLEPNVGDLPEMGDEEEGEEEESKEVSYERGSAHRDPEYGVDLMFLDRWSPRAMSGDPVSEHELMSMFEAARWAPSSYNNQPWRFLYAMRNSQHWDTFFNLLGDFNQKWAKRAWVLVMIVSKTTFDRDGSSSQTHSFDTGAAWENFALQGARNGLVVHGMEGFDYEKAQKDLDVPDEYSVEAMAAVGKPGEKSLLPEEMREREEPSDRKPISEIVGEGPFSF